MKRFMNICITGVAGFIGYHLADRLLRRGCRVVGIDSMSDYYDVQLKKDRISRLIGHPSFTFRQMDVSEQPEQMEQIIGNHSVDTVFHLAAQPGVGYSLENPQAYIQANITGFTNVIEACRKQPVRHLIYASSSSVYGANTRMPFSTADSADHPLSIYAATKKANELLAHTYSHLYGLPVTGVRLFTVYGPWGRPDMAYFSFTQKILEGLPIKLFNYGDMKRDFTYIGDIVDGLELLTGRVPEKDPRWDSGHPRADRSYAPYRIYNMGNSRPVSLMHLVRTLEELLGVKAVIELMPMQPGDVRETYADIGPLQREAGFAPKTPIEEGLKHFVAWYKNYYL